MNSKKSTIIIVVIIIIIVIVIAIYLIMKDRDVKDQYSGVTDYYWDKNTSEWKKINNNNNKRICLTAETQQQISDEINKKLQEINTCDCADSCPLNIQQKNLFQPTIAPYNLSPTQPIY